MAAMPNARASAQTGAVPEPWRAAVSVAPVNRIGRSGDAVVKLVGRYQRMADDALGPSLGGGYTLPAGRFVLVRAAAALGWGH
jgi:hypothetical protein